MPSQLDLGIGRGRHVPRAPRPVRPVPCVICGRKALHDDDYFKHPGCEGKPQPCECGAPSMPYPPCAHCFGSGRVGGDVKRGEICNGCPPGPCVRCCSVALLARVRNGRSGS